MSSSTASGITTNYLYNALGQRVKKSSPNETYWFIYDENDNVIAEYDSSGNLTDEYVYMDNRPLALLRSSNLYYIYTDHLNTPRAITDTSNTLQWTWENKEAFGNNPPVEVVPGFKFNFRLPGQYFDNETNLNYNIHRDYNPFWGRYMQSDPLGLVASINTFIYANGNPLSKKDPTGLFTSDVHFKMTMAALKICKSMSFMDKLRLSYAVAAADWTPTWDESQAVINAHWHDMSQLSTMGLNGLAKLMAQDFVREQMASRTTQGIGRAIHTWQDTAARGHRGQQRYSGHFDFMHFLGDLIPTDSERTLAIINTMSLLGQLPECGCNQ